MTRTTIRPQHALGLFAIVYALYVAVSVLVPSSLLGLSIRQVIALALPAALLVRASGVPLAAGLGLRRAPAGAWIGAALIGVSFWYPNLWLVNSLIEPSTAESIERSLGWTREPWPARLLAIAIVPSICEELLLRGTIARGLRPALGIAGAIVVTAILFASLHSPPVRMIPSGVFGLVLAFAALTADSALPCILMHLLNNLITAVFWEFFAPVAAWRPETAAAALALTVAGLALLWRSRVSAPT